MRFLRHRQGDKKNRAAAGSDPFVVKEGEYSYGHLEDAYYYSDWTERSFLADNSNKKRIINL